MFPTILQYELRHWLRQPSVYVYAAIFLFISAGAMAAQAGIWGEQTAVPGMESIANAPAQLQEMAGFFLKLILFLIPAIIGASVYRDFRSNIHPLLYSYPLAKSSYLLAKFCSAFIVLALIVSTIGFGFFIGARLPGVNPALVGPFRLAAYLQVYLVYLLPNVLLFGAIVFAVVALSRNIYAGFITIVLLFFMQMLAGSLFAGMESRSLAAILDPFGQKASFHYTRYWTLAERNELLLPVKGVVLYNRLLWLGIAAAIFGLGYKQFSFHHQGATILTLDSQVGLRTSYTTQDRRWTRTSYTSRQPLPNLRQIAHQALSYGFKKNNQGRIREKKPGSIVKVKLTEARCDFSFRQQLITAWRLMVADFRYILTSWLFISILAVGVLGIFFQQAEMNPQYGFRTLPVTWKMLMIPTYLFLGAVHVLTFLYAGMLVHRARIARMGQLVDSAPVPNWVFLFSKWGALAAMQMLLLFLIMAAGVAVQLYNGYYELEIGLYVFQLYGLYLPGLIIWAFAALFVQTLFTNPYLGLFLLILGSMGVMGLPDLGIRHYVFRFNMAPEFAYSALDGFGATLPPWLLYKTYWMLGGLVLLMGALLLWTRGLPFSFSERLAVARARFKGRTATATLLFLACFLALGFTIYLEDNYWYEKINSAKEEERWKVENEKRYKKHEGSLQPRITAVKVNMNLFPETRDFKADGEYLLVNRSGQAIDTLLIHYSYDEGTNYHFDKPARLLSKDTFIRFDIHVLEQGLAPGDSLKMFFEVWNEPNTLFRTSSPVKYNGTYITNEVFPGLGYRPIELADNGKRAKYGLPPTKNEKPHPSDRTALNNSYSSKDSDWITFEATVSTSEDQIALAPGYLQREWIENGRRCFHYKMDSQIKDYYGFNSGRYDVLRDNWNGVSLEIYHHPGHEYNLSSMMEGLKGALAYNTRHFSPYQHRQARIIEFPATVGRFATTFANSIPFAEIHFIADTRDESAIDFPFYVAAHEMAHQWWGNQLIPADVLGARMLTESMAEYTALKVLEKEYGKTRMRKFLKLDLDLYLRGRSRESEKERPLMYAELDQDYINYRKGALAFYALSDYLGEEQLNGAIKDYLAKVSFQAAPYTTSIEMLEYIRRATPDSLQYLIKDLFETITLYDNRVAEAKTMLLDNGQYQVDLEFIVSKYRSDGKGQRFFEDEAGATLSYDGGKANGATSSLPLADYVEIGLFGEGDNGEKAELYLEKHKITRINNRVTIFVDQKPVEAGVDPYLKLIDANSEDNRRGI
ncbi:MAG: hypothetical protein H6557_22465 [Lewinellaceae bacterium]|nr:hypothetical protein [Phaeodactylibacter sp.]MCB9039389.1 hypothetical protein [Lewinellaceae bacterium]